MRARHPDSDISFEETSKYPGLHTDPGAAVVDYTRRINPLDAIGIQCLVCGPGSIEQAHKPDEFIAREQLQLCDRMLENLVHSCRTGSPVS